MLAAFGSTFAAGGGQTRVLAMKWNKPTDEGPMTIAKLGGRLIVVSCNKCPHRASLRGNALNLPSETRVDEIWRFLKCSKCGSRDVLAYPQTLRSMRQGMER